MLAFLPSFIAYGIAVLFGDLRFRMAAYSRKKIISNLKGVLGDQLTNEERLRLARRFFRLRSCEMIDEMRLSGKGKALIRLVEVRGLEHIRDALASGRGAIMCGAHFGSCYSSFSLLGALGFPVSVIGRWTSEADPNPTLMERLVFRVGLEPITHHLHRPNILVEGGNLGAAVMAAKVLRENELVYTNLDSTVAPEDRGRAMRVDFLNGKAVSLPGAIRIAKFAKAPILVMLMHRSADWRHQVLEITPPIQLEGDDATAFRRCLAVLEAAIRRDPAHWRFWIDDRITRLGLLPGVEPKQPHAPRESILAW